MKKLLRLISLATISVLVFTACEGPMGPMGQKGDKGDQGTPGEAGERGDPGKDATCVICHKPASVKAIEKEFYRFSAHSMTPLRTGGGGACAVCHTQEGFIYAVENGVSSIPTAINSQISEDFNCYTCHSSIHDTAYYDWRLTSTAPVSLVMWSGEKTVNLTFDNSSSNLCVSCHQPRGITGINNILSNPDAPNTNLGTSPAYSGGIHYNTGQILAAGVGGIEFGSGYTNSVHVATTSCATCHMPKDSDRPGYLGHRFDIKDNFDGCNASCHGGRMSETNSRLLSSQADLEQLLEELADKLKDVVGGGEHVVTPNGNINTYHATGNPTGYWKNPDNGNLDFPALTNAQYGAIINYQLVARSAGARSACHNYPYVKALLENTIAIL